MTSRLSVPAPLRLTAQALAILGAAAMLAFSVQLVAADQDTVTAVKSSDAVEPVGPGESFAFTITVDVGALPAGGVTDLVIDDGSFDAPQLAINSADYAIGAGPDVNCDITAGANVRCEVGTVAASTQVVATINVTVDADVQIACTDPEVPGDLDTTVRNSADVSWEDADGGAVPFEIATNLLTVDLDCDGWVPPPTAPDTTILTGPTEGSSTTSTSASFTFSGTNTPTSFTCTLDAGAPAPCPSPKSYTGLSVGSHTFSVAGVNAGGTDATPATRTWTVTGTPTTPFTDISGHPFENDIKWLYNEDITGGCTATRYCPNDNVSRDQMATFLDRVLPLPGTTTDFFDDDDGSIHEGAINRLAAAGITGGCATRQYCPKAPVMRDQMASFLSRAYALPGTTTDFFTDDETNIHEGPINRLADSEITGGCGPTTYCPRVAVTRGQMAAFLHRADPLLD